MAEQEAHPDGQALPHDRSDVVNGVGRIEQVVALSGHADADGVYRGRCRSCGYDRGVYRSHTEVEAWSLSCRECNALLGEE